MAYALAFIGATIGFIIMAALAFSRMLDDEADRQPDEQNNDLPKHPADE